MKEGPQLEDGYTSIANEIVEALSRISLSSYETRCLFFIIRKTYGWNKKEDWISLSQFEEATGITRPHICRAIKMLVEQRIIVKSSAPSLPKGAMKVSFNKYHSQWRGLPKGARSHSSLPKGAMTITKRGKGVLPKGAHTKETPTKETITKENKTTSYGNASVNAIINSAEECFGNLDSTKGKNRQYAWLLLKKAKSLQPNASEEEALKSCIQLIRAASQHNWWKSRITKIETIYKNAHMITKAVQEDFSTSFTPKI